MRLWVCAALLVGAVACDDTEFNSSGGGGGDYEASADGMVALMHDHCNECHPALKPEFDTTNLIDDVENDAGKYIVAGSRADSLMWQRITDPTLPPMPPTGLLAADQIEPIGEWIDAGAPLWGEGGEE